MNDGANSGGSANGGSGGSSGGSGGVAGASVGGSGGSAGSGTGGTGGCVGAAGQPPSDPLQLAFAAEDAFPKGGEASGITPITLGDCTSAVAIAEPEQKRIAILRVDGQAFADPEFVGTGVDLASAAVGDLDADGIADLIAVERGATPGLVTFLGDASGSFATQQHTPLDFDPDMGATLAVGRLDGDGFDDVVVASQSHEVVQIMLGDHAGGFTKGDAYSNLGSPGFVGIADLDGESGTDLYVVTPLELVVLLGTGIGAFLPQTGITVDDSALAVGGVTGDFNGDQLDDIAISFGGAIGRVISFVNAGNGTFVPHEPQVVGPYPGPPVAADFNRDGLLDVAAGHATEKNVTVALGAGDGNFLSPASFPATSGTSPRLILPFRIEPEPRPSILIGYATSVNLGRLANVSTKN